MDAITTMNLRRNINERKIYEKINAFALDYFYNQDHEAIRLFLEQDLVNIYSLEDIRQLKPVTIDFFVSRFLQQRLNVYNTAPIFRPNEKADDKSKERFATLLEELEYRSVLQDTGYKCLLHNTILATVKYNKALDKLFIENDINIGNCEVLTYEGYNYEPAIIAYEMMYRGEFVWVVWDRENEEHYLTRGEVRFNEIDRQVIVTKEKEKVGENTDITIPDYWPWAVYRYKKQNAEFWGNGLTALVELNRIANILLTLCNDDAINETIAVWLYNFNPAMAGNKRSDGKISANARNPLWVESGLGKTGDPKVQIARAPMVINDIIAFIEMLTGIISQMHGIDNIMKAELKENLAGISIRLQNEPLLRQWKEDIYVFQPYDLALAKAAVAVNNEERGKANYINPNIFEGMVVDYQAPSVVSDEQAEWDLIVAKAEWGAASIVEFVQKENPEMSKDEVKELIQERLDEHEELFGSKHTIPLELDNEDQNINPATGDGGGNEQNQGAGDNSGGIEERGNGQGTAQEKDNGENQKGSGGTAAKGGRGVRRGMAKNK